MPGIDLKYLLGSEGSPDYLVIAEQQGLRLGVKGLMSAGPNETIMLVLRVRTVKADGQEVEDGKVFVNSWPIPFEKISTIRASVELVNLVNRTHLQFETLIKQASHARFASKAFDYFENMGIKLDVKREDLVTHLHKQWFDEASQSINSDDPKFLFSTYVAVSKFVEAVKNGGLTVSQNSVTVNGKAEPWPEPGKAKKPKRKKSIKGDDGTGKEDEKFDNVVNFKTSSDKTLPPNKT